MLLKSQNFLEKCHQVPYSAIPTFRNPLLKIQGPPLYGSSLPDSSAYITYIVGVFIMLPIVSSQDMWYEYAELRAELHSGLSFALYSFIFFTCACGSYSYFSAPHTKRKGSLGTRLRAIMAGITHCKS